MLFLLATTQAEDGRNTQSNTRSLDGTWNVIAGDDGMQQEWWTPGKYPAERAKPIPVPGNTYEALPHHQGIAWYLRSFDLAAAPRAGRRSFLRFEAVQYLCRVWLNGRELGSHEGGETPFELEATGKLVAGANSLVLRVDNSNLGSPIMGGAGKIPAFYPQGGVAGHVDLVEQPTLRIADVYAKADPATGTISVEITCDNAGAASAVELNAVVSERKSRKEINRAKLSVQVPTGTSVQHLALKVASPHKWDLDDPFLYTVEARAKSGGDEDLYRVERLGFRDFRIVDGFFELNGRRIFLKSTHHNHYDPVRQMGGARDMKSFASDFAQLKAAGFNAFRSITCACLPEQMAIADDLGFLIYEEHAGSWKMSDPNKFPLELAKLLHRDRHSPSLAMFGLLNEVEQQKTPGIFQAARDLLPALRAANPAPVIMLSSGRFDLDLTTASAANPGSSTWDVFLGGEGPKPTPCGTLGVANGYPVRFPSAAGDSHIYNSYPLSWSFIGEMRTYGASTRPVFVSEGGQGSAFDPYTEKQKLTEAQAPPTAAAWGWAQPRIDALEAVWARYGLVDAYPKIPDMIADSQRSAARQRELFTRAVRSNPQISGYSMTSMTDAFGLGEGIWDNFRGWKAGHEEAVSTGWAPTRFCLLVNPAPIAAGKPFHLVAALADEDRLPAGDLQVVLRVRDNAGVELWKKTIPLKLTAPEKRPFAFTLLDEDLPVLPLAEGNATIEATLSGAGNLPGSRLVVPVFDAARHPRIKGAIQVVGVSEQTRAFLTAAGATVTDFDPQAKADHLAILCGPALPPDWKAASWRQLYAQVARGAHLVVVGPDVLKGKSGANHYLPLENHGKPAFNLCHLYHGEIVAKPGIVFEGLPARLLTPDVYSPQILCVGGVTVGETPPENAIAVYINDSGMGSINDSPMIATWKHGAGRITVCRFPLLQMSSPVSDRLLINLVRHALANTSAPQPLPADYEAQLDKLGISD